MVRNRLSMVSGAGGNNSTLLFAVLKRKDLVERAPLLESPGALKIVELKENLLARHLRQLVRVRRGRKINVAVNTLPRLLNAA